jgi:sulfatase modifying factor 1
LTAAAGRKGGNAYEWVSDWYASDYYASSPRENPRGHGAGRFRSLRGGAWSYYTTRLRLSARELKLPGDAKVNVGFRCAVEGR